MLLDRFHCNSHSRPNTHYKPGHDDGTNRQGLPDRDQVAEPKVGQMPLDHNGIVDVSEPIVVGPGEVFDGKGKYFRPTKALGDGGQSEGRLPVFMGRAP